MISAKQVNNILTRSFSGGSSILSPKVTFTAVASSYLAGSTTPVVLSGSILENDAKNIAWSIKDPSGSNLLSDSTGSLSPSFTLVSPPTSVGTYIYTLYVTYEDSDGVAQPAITTLATITVSTPAFAGMLSGPSDDILVPADLTLAIENTLTPLTISEIINPFIVSGTGVLSSKIVIVIPDSYGVVTAIEDNTDTNVLDDDAFSTIYDSANLRTIYVSDLNFTPIDWRFKVIF